MTAVVSDSGPCIHLAIIAQFALLPRYFPAILTVREVYDEVVTQGRGLPGSQELAAACDSGFVQLVGIADPQWVAQLGQCAPPGVSDIDIAVLALAIEQQLPLLSDDAPLRVFAETQGIIVSGTIGLLIQARLDHAILLLKPLLDQLITPGFHLNPQGPVSNRVIILWVCAILGEGNR
jgi:predicted nucleic acid-binding protein